MNQRLLAVFSVTLAATSAGWAQQAALTVDAIFGSTELSGELAAFEWMRDGRHYTVIEADENGRTDLYRVAAETGAREVLVRARDLVPQDGTEPITIEEYQFSPDESQLLIFTNSVRVWRQNTKGEFYIWNLATRRLTPLSTRPGLQQFAKFSPDGRYIGFVRDHDIFVRDQRTGIEKRLTTDGGENIINGTSDWVYEEELDLRDAFRFSADGRRVAFWRLDQSAILPFYLLDETSLYPTLQPVRYPKAGTENSEVRIGVVEIETGTTAWIDLGPEKDIYIAELDFADSSTEIWLTRLNRHQNRLDLLVANAETGRSRVVMTDADSAWVDANVPTWIDRGERFVFPTERNGVRQLLLFSRDGKRIRDLTPPTWDVTELFGVDQRRRVVYFTGAMDGPLVRPVYRVGLDGKNLRRVSAPGGTHAARFNPQFALFVDTYSTAAHPPLRSLHREDGRLVRTIASNADLMARLDSLALAKPEFTRVPGGGGVELNAYFIKPLAFDSTHRYPLLLFVYGGPGSQTVRDSWGGSRYLWHQMLASQGYLVASVDNRGTGARGRAFKKLTYLRLGQSESDDQIGAARFLGGLPYVDEDRIGIWGWSYGGYLSLLSMFRGDGTFRAAISVAPVTDWRFYDTIYTERYMRTPRENAAGYDAGAPLTYADRLRGRLLVVHGTADDNVHPQNTTLLIKRLEDANRQFDLRLYPNKTHSIAGATTRVNLYRLLTEWLEENLKAEPATVSLSP